MSIEYKKGDFIKFRAGKEIMGIIAEKSGDHDFLVDIALDDYQTHKAWFNNNDCQALYHVRAAEVRLLVNSSIVRGLATPVEELVYRTDEGKSKKVTLLVSSSSSGAKAIMDAYNKGELKSIAGFDILDISFQ